MNNTKVWTLAEMKDSSQDWISCVDDGVPAEGIYVLGRYTGGNWGDDTDQEGCNYVWSKRVQSSFSETNNHETYIWDTFGPLKLFGQDISHWRYVSRLKTQRYFVDDNSVIYTVFEDGTSNCPCDIEMSQNGQEVSTLGGSSQDSEREITGTYTCHASLTDLARVIEA